MKKESKSLKGTKKLVISAVLSAMSFVFMYLGALTGVFDLCAAMAGAVCCAFAVIEIRGIWPWLICAVSGILCLIFLPDKFAALEYIVLGGIYPILKSFAERLPRIVSWCVKLSVFNALFALCLALAKFVFGLTDEWVAFNLGNVCLFMFDAALTVFASYYIRRLRGKLRLDL